MVGILCKRGCTFLLADYGSCPHSFRLAQRDKKFLKGGEITRAAGICPLAHAYV